jgi:hypothetical protein
MNNEKLLESTLRNLVEKLDVVFNSDEMKAIYISAFAHGVEFHGPTIKKELDDARKLLTSLEKKNRK